jgi:hypothetical protein
MDRTSTHPVDRSVSQPALDPSSINLRPLLWRSRASLGFLLLIAGIAYVVLMTFSPGSVTAAAPDPAVVQAEAEAHLARNVAIALEAARPADQPLALPVSNHYKGGLLLPLRSSVVGQ